MKFRFVLLIAAFGAIFLATAAARHATRVHIGNLYAFEAGHQLQHPHPAGKTHRLGLRRASETVHPPVILPSVTSVPLPDVAAAPPRHDDLLWHHVELTTRTPRAPPVRQPA